MKILIITAVIIAVLLLVIAAILFLFEDKLADFLLESWLRRTLNLDIDIKDTDVSIMNSSIDLKESYAFNPPGFGEKLMADIPRIYIDFDPKGLFGRAKHFNSIIINLKELVIIKDKDGRVNVKTIGPKKTKETEEKKSEKKEPATVRIDRLELTIGKVIYKDYSAGTTEPVIQKFEMNIKGEVYTNLAGIEEVVNAIITRALINTAIDNLVDLGAQRLKQGLDNITKGGKDLLEENIAEKGRKILDKAKDLLQIIPLEQGKKE